MRPTPNFILAHFSPPFGMGPDPHLTILLHFCPPPDPVLTFGLSLSTFVKGMRIEPLVHCSLFLIFSFEILKVEHFLPCCFFCPPKL